MHGPLRTLIATLLVSATASTAMARPLFVHLDVADKKKHPSKYGIEVAAKKDGPSTGFVVSLSKEASSVFENAEAFYTTPLVKKPVVKVRTRRKDGRVRLLFSMPTKNLKHCVLQLNSLPIPGTNTPQFNFHAYRLRLENVPTAKDSARPTAPR